MTVRSLQGKIGVVMMALYTNVASQMINCFYFLVNASAFYREGEGLESTS